MSGTLMAILSSWHKISVQSEVSGMPETIFWWVFTLAGVLAFFFSYGIVRAVR